MGVASCKLIKKYDVFAYSRALSQISGAVKTEEMAAIPEDLRNLRDFPQYDATFQDHPLFRRHLEQWAGKTKKV